MLKFLRYIIYIAVLSLIVVAAYDVRMYLCVPYVERFVSKKVGTEIEMENFYFQPFKRGIEFVNIKVNGKIKADKVLVKISPSKILKNIKNPAEYISDIEFKGLLLNFENAGEMPSSGNKRGFSGFPSLPFSVLRVSADTIKIKSEKENFIFSDAEINLDSGQIFASCIILPEKNPIYANGVMKILENGNGLNTEFTFVSEKNIEGVVSASGSIDLSDFSSRHELSIGKIKFKNFEISDSTGYFSVNRDGIDSSIFGEFGTISASGSSSSGFSLKTKINLSEINSGFDGTSEAKLFYKNGEGTLDLFLRNLSIYGQQPGDFDIRGIRQISGDYDIVCKYGKYGKIFATYEKDGSYNCRMTFNDKETGKASGNINTGELKIDASALPVSNIPFFSELGKNAAGIFTVKGQLDETAGLIEFSLKDFKTSKIGKTDIFGTISKSADIYVFYFYKSDKSVVFNSVMKSGKILSTDFKFINTDIANVLRAFGHDSGKISGNAGGRIKYEKDAITEFDIKAYDGSFYGNKYKKLDAKGDMNLSRINIIKFHLRGEDEQVDAFADGLIGFTNVNPVSSLDIRMRKINIGGALFDGDITLKGSLNPKNEVFGEITGNMIKISGVPFNNLKADAVITTKKFIVSNIKSNNGLYGDFSCVSDGENWNVSGGINFKNTDIDDLYPSLRAEANASVKINGTVVNPKIYMSVSVKKGHYSDIPFVFNADAFYSDGALKIKNANLTSSKMKFSVKGKYSQGQDGRLSVNFENINEKVINEFVGFRTPVKGEFSGQGTLFQYKKSKPRLKMDIKSKTAYVKGVKLNNIKSAIDVYGTRISVSSASARLSDSEIRADKGSFNIKNGVYDLSLFLVNTHLGPLDVFGRIDIDGKMNKRKGGSIYKGKIGVKNFWINKYRLASFSFDYNIKNKNFSFSQSSGTLLLSGGVNFSDKIKLDKINISKGGAIFAIDGFFADKDFNLAAKADDLSLYFLGELLDSPVEADGKIDISMDASGSFASPDIKFSAHSVNGNITGIPYDSVNIEIVSSDNKAEIKKAELFKKNELNMNVKGTFPLWLDKSVEAKMKDMPVDVRYEAEDMKMHILKYLSSGEIKPKSGKLMLKGEIKGVPSNITNNGRFAVSNGVFDAKTYLGRVKDFNVDIIWDNNEVKINKFSGKSGSGKFNATGGLTLEGFNIKNFDVSVKTDNKGIPIKVPQLPITDSIFSKGILHEYSAGQPRFDIKIEGSPSKPKISGTIILESTRFCFPPPDDFSSDVDDIFPGETEFDIELKAAKNTKFENSYADTWINGSLKIRGTLDDVQCQGIIDTQRGTVKYLGTIFDIISAKVEVVGDNVYISGEAETNVYSAGRSDSETIVMVITRSPVDELNIRFYSKDDPTMDSQTAFAKLTGTEQTVDSGANNQNMILGIVSDFDLRQQALRIIDSSFATPFAKNILRKTGLADNFKVSYVDTDRTSSTMEDPTFTDLLQGTKYSVEKNITNQFLLGYSVTFDQVQNKLDLRHELEMRYRLYNNLFLSGSYEIESENSLHEPDRRFMVQHQFRFGLPSNNKKKGAKNGND